MYADRFASPGRIKPGALTIAIALNGGVVAALLLSSPTFRRVVLDPPLTTTNVPIDPVPPEITPEPKPQPDQPTRATPRETIETVTPIVEAHAGEGPVIPPGPPPIPGPPTGLDGMIGGGGTIASLPVLIAAAIDARYAGDFQPDYPAIERRAEREGVVRIRVLIGADGRVRQAERVAATSDAFWRAAEQQALRKWRFRPATRDGVPEESWRTMTLTFVLKD